MSRVTIRTRPPTREDSSYSEEDKKEQSIKYIEYKELLERYPRDKTSPTSSGTYGDVYRSKEYAVKIFRDDKGLNSITRELNIYSTVDHPCIMKPICWSVDEERGISFLVMPLGMDIKVAYQNGRIHIRSIIEDLLSAISFLNENGIAHADIKPGNIIFHDDKAKLIDMGIVKYASLGDDGQYYITGEAYSLFWMDPEYSFNQYNRINSEVYAAAASVMEIYTKHDATFGSTQHYYNQMKQQGSSLLRSFIGRAILPANERPSALNLGVTLGLNLSSGTIKQEPDILNIPIRKDIAERFVIAHRAFSLSTESLFLSLKLMQKTSKLFEEDADILYVAVLSDLANDVSSDTLIGPDLWKGMFEWADNITSEDFAKIFIRQKMEILSYLGGSIYSKTLWNYAKSSEDLVPLLRSMVLGETPSIEMVDGYSKCIDTDDLIPEEEIDTLFNYSEEEKSGESSLVRVNPCHLDTEPVLEILEQLLEKQDWKQINIGQSLPVIIHNRELLHQLELETALMLFEDLVGGFPDAYLSNLTLDKICTYNWRKYAPMIIENKLHPFDKKWVGKW